jgi:hypothetical protein
VDSVNSVSLEKLKATIPNMVEWYVYDGQQQPLPEAVNLINVIYVKPKEECPE